MSLPAKLFQCSNCGQTMEILQDVLKPLICQKAVHPSTMIRWIIKVTPEEKAEFLHGGTPP